AQLDHDATELARRLASAGVGEGDRVAMLQHNSAWAALLIHAVMRLGATLMPVNLRLTPSEIAWQLCDCDARLLVVDDPTASLGESVREIVPGIRIASTSAVPGNPDESLQGFPQADVALRSYHDTSSVLAIVYTSGTTGQPKGAMLTVGNFWWSALGSALNIGNDPRDRWLACLPLFHVGGLSIVLRAAIYGIAIVVHDGFDADAVNAAIDNDDVTVVSVVAVMLQRMLEAHGGQPYPDTLRCVLLGGGPAPLPLLERCADLRIPVAQTYGLTETTSQLATLAPADALRKIGSAGRPLYPNLIRIAADGRDAAPGEAGEILVRGPVVMAGYVGQAEATAHAVVDGWLHTGDAGSLDDDGFLYVLDRRNDLIITGGENVYPAEVESALLSHPSVVEAGVVAVSDATWGQSVAAFVRVSDIEATESAELERSLRTHLEGVLAVFKRPRRYFVVGEPLPRTASGKLRRSDLRAMVRPEPPQAAETTPTR
ncbi:MAG: o-succinylbenzoate--CoA ligase, partial [Gemmatimonadota bacterium]|nr:o-succinylbenzoate--CoA ligase [Gemmatimonadota bacterium]